MDKIKELHENWDAYGRTDPFWAIATRKEKKGNKWDINEFFQTGKTQIDWAIGELQLIDVEIEYAAALDFGCGVGRVSQALANYFDRVVGVDIAPSMIELAHKYNAFRDRCQYYLNQESNLSIFEENTFDFVFSTDVLQHMDPEIAKNYIKEFLRVLAPRGTLMFQMPSDNSQVIRKILYKLGINNRAGSLISWLRGTPYMEFHYIRKEIIEQTISKYGGTVKKTIPNPRSHGVISYYYVATKNEQDTSS